MGHTGFDTGIQEPELAAVRQGGLDEIAVASLDDPLIVADKELAKQSETFFRRFTLGTPIPSDFIQRQSWNVGVADEAASHRAFTRSRIA
jgi:hypothetical protein